MGNEVYKERKLKGLCVRCGKVKEKGNGVFCNDCHEKDKEYKKLRRDYLFNRGKCIKCGNVSYVLYVGEKIMRVTESGKKNTKRKEILGKTCEEKSVATKGFALYVVN